MGRYMHVWVDGWMDYGVICGGDIDQSMRTVVRGGGGGEGQLGVGQCRNLFFCWA